MVRNWCSKKNESDSASIFWLQSCQTHKFDFHRWMQSKCWIVLSLSHCKYHLTSWWAKLGCDLHKICHFLLLRYWSKLSGVHLPLDPLLVSSDPVVNEFSVTEWLNQIIGNQLRYNESVFKCMTKIITINNYTHVYSNTALQFTLILWDFLDDFLPLFLVCSTVGKISKSTENKVYSYRHNYEWGKARRCPVNQKEQNCLGTPNFIAQFCLCF